MQLRLCRPVSYDCLITVWPKAKEKELLLKKIFNSKGNSVHRAKRKTSFTFLGTLLTAFYLELLGCFCLVDFIARFEQLVGDAILDIEYFSFHEELLVIPRVRVLTAEVKCIVGGLFFLLKF